MRAAFTITTPRPPDEVFAYVADLRHAPEWYSTIGAAALVAGTPGEVGSRFALTGLRSPLGENGYEYETTAAEPLASVAFRYVHPRLVGTEEYTLSATPDGGTTLAFRSQAGYTNSAEKLLTPVAATALKLYQARLGRRLERALAQP